MREWILAAVMFSMLMAAMVAFALGLREARGAKDEMKEIRIQLEILNTYMEKISH